MAHGPLTFDPDAHLYTLDARPVRSVTNILHTVGLNDFSQIPPPILRAAQARGTRVHQAVHYYNDADLDVDAFHRDFPAEAGYLDSWITLVGSGRLQTILCEHRVASRQPPYAGTFDWLGLVDGHAALVDFATGDPVDACKHLQTAAYVAACYQWKDQPEEPALKAFFDAHGTRIARYSVQLDPAGGLPRLTPYTDAREYRTFRVLAEAVCAVDTERARRPPVAWSWT